MIYFLQTIVYAALLYGVYFFLLRKHTQYTWSRIFLLLCATLPFVIPFVTLPGLKSNAAPRIISLVDEPIITVINKANYTDHNHLSIMWLVYIYVGLILFLRFFMEYLNINRFIKRHEAKRINGVFIITNTGYGPASWNNYIFLPGNNDNASILKHELTHIRLRHSWDIIFMRLLECFFWPNIMLLFISRELKIVHEFQADAAVGQDEEHYAYTLLNEIFNTKQFSLSHTFFHNPLKRRIMMLQKNNAKKTFAFTFLSAVLLISVSATAVWAQSAKSSHKKDKKVFTYIEHMPQPTVDINEYLSENLVYPASARKKNIEGRVILQFIIDKEGNVIDPVVIRSPDTSLSNAAVLAIKNMPKWIPGETKGEKVDVRYSLPVTFKLR